MMFNLTNTKEAPAEFTVDLNDPGQKFCAYLHIVEYAPDDRRVMFSGSCEFRTLLEAPDARRNKAWRKYVSPHKLVTVRVMAVFDNPYEAFNEAIKNAKELKPYCNLYGEVELSRGMVKCLDDGKVFKNAAAACKHYDIVPGTMSNHLNRRPGYTHIRNMKFERIVGE